MATTSILQMFLNLLPEEFKHLRNDVESLHREMGQKFSLKKSERYILQRNSSTIFLLKYAFIQKLGKMCVPISFCRFPMTNVKQSSIEFLKGTHLRCT